MAHENPRLRFTDEELTPGLERYAKQEEKAADKAEAAQAKLAKGKKKVKRRMTYAEAKQTSGTVSTDAEKRKGFNFEEKGEAAKSSKLRHETEKTAASPKAGKSKESADNSSPSKPQNLAAALAAAPVKAAAQGVHHELAEYEDDNVGIESVHGLEESVETSGSMMSHSARSRKLMLHFEEKSKGTRSSRLRHEAEKNAASPKAGKTKKTADNSSPSKSQNQAAASAAAPVKAAARGGHHELAEYENDIVGVNSAHSLEESVETGGNIMSHSARSQKLMFHFEEKSKGTKSSRLRHGTEKTAASPKARKTKEEKGAKFSKLRHETEKGAASDHASAASPKAGKPKKAADKPSSSKPQNQAAALAAVPVKAAARGVHHELAEYEDDNVGIKSVHDLEESAETGGAIMRHSSRSRKLKHFRQAEKAEKRLEKANVNLLYQKSLRDNPQSAKNPLSRWQQKRQIKKQYAAKLREAQRAGSAADWVKSVGNGAKRAAAGIEKAVGFVQRHKKGIAIIMALFVSLTVTLNLMSSCTAMLESGLSILGSSTYPSADADMLGAEAAYAGMEAELEEYLNDYDDTHNYNEYIFELDEIGHDPYVLTALLSALHAGGWMLDEVEETLETIFNLQYILTETVTEETRYDEDDEPYTWSICTVKLETTDMSHLPVFLLDNEGMSRYATYMATGGNRPDLFPSSEYPGAVQRGDYLDYDVPPEALEDETFAAMLAEGEKYLGYPYVWGGASPATSFDCSGFVSWVINHSGWNYGRLTAQGLFNVTTPVTAANAKPGDLVFFKGTYNTTEVSHVGIYVGNHMMLHCGSPISYANLNENYWQQHIFCYGRLSQN